VDDYGKAKVALHNATNHLDAIETKHRKRIRRIEALRVELLQLESGLPSLSAKLEQSRDDLKIAKATYRALRHERRSVRNLNFPNAKN
jgi:hypothetical protein